MTYNKNILKRFNVKLSLKEAQEKFINKINNALFYSAALNTKAFNFSADRNFEYRFCQEYGLEFGSGMAFHLHHRPFTEYILKLNCLVGVLATIDDKLTGTLLDIIEDSLEESPLDLNLRVLKSSMPYSIMPKGAKLLDGKLIDDSLGILTDTKYESVRNAFEKGLKEFMQSTKEKPRLKNAIRDMHLSMDELAKIILNDKNVGLKHLLKNENWAKTNLNKYYQGIYFQYNEMLDKFAKHTGKYAFSSQETESIMYLTGLFVRLTLGKI